MPGINYWAVIVAAVVAFVIGGLCYSPFLFGKAWVKLRGMDAGAAAGAMGPAAVLVEFVRGFIVAVVLAGFVVHLGIVNEVVRSISGSQYGSGFKLRASLASSSAGPWFPKA
jgi:hypothetical protein